MISLIRQIKFGFQNFLRNGWLSIAQVLILSITTSIWILTIFSFVSGNLILDEVGKKFNIELTVKKEATALEIDQIENFLNSLSEVESYEKIENSEKIEKLREILSTGDDGSGIGLSSWDEQLSTLQLGASFRVELKNPDQYNSFFGKIDSSTLSNLFFDLESDKGQIQDKVGAFAKWSFFAKVSTISFSIFFVILSFMITFESIKTSIESKKNEIEIMKLVGAETGFIKKPLLFEGFIAASFSEFIVISSTFFVIRSFQDQLTNFFSRVVEFDPYKFYTSNFLYISVGTFFGLLLISYISSSISMRKHLKV